VNYRLSRSAACVSATLTEIRFIFIAELPRQCLNVAKMLRFRISVAKSSSHHLSPACPMTPTNHS
jgi:hypothetical protein